MEIRLKEILKEKRISPVQFAKMMGCTMQTVYNIQSETTSPSVRQIRKMAELLDVPEWKMLYSKEDMMQAVSELKKKDKNSYVCQCPKCGAFLHLTAVSTPKKLGND